MKFTKFIKNEWKITHIHSFSFLSPGTSSSLPSLSPISSPGCSPFSTRPTTSTSFWITWKCAKRRLIRTISVSINLKIKEFARELCWSNFPRDSCIIIAFLSENREHVTRFIQVYLGTDGLFLLQLIAQHADVVFTTELIAALFKTYIEIEAQRK